jgi:DNA mismatch repair protein MutS2
MIDQEVLQKLEFDKVLTHISSYSITDPGKNLIHSLLPTDYKIEIEKIGLLIEEAQGIIIRFGDPPIEYLPDLDKTLSESKIEGAVLSAKKIIEILNLSKTSRLLHNFLKKESKKDSQFHSIIQNLFNDKVFEHQIEKIINEQGEVKENASKILAEIRRDINSKRSDLVKTIKRIIKNLKEDDIIREDYLTLRDGRMVIPIKAEHKRHIRGFIHSESSTGQTVYIEPEETLDLNNDIISLSFAEKREIERLLKELTRMISSVSEQLKISLYNVALIDSIFARAKYSIETIGCFPEINLNKPLRIADARHPLLLKKLGRKNTVPLNFELVGNNVVVITGPNAGGKTVVLKTIGILSLMLQAGIPVPVDKDSNFHIFSKILIDIGDQQSLEDDLSTFSSHLKSINNILTKADDKSLVLLDEIGTGTDPAEGSALAAAILKILLDKKAVVFASTHHGSLKVFAYNIKGMQNAAMQFDHQTLSPTYIFNLGVPGSSYAFEIAKRIGLADEVINGAKNFIDSNKHNLEKFLSDLEEQSNKLAKKLKEVENENERLKILSDNYKNNLQKLENEKKEILKKTKIQAEEFLYDINKKIESVIKELRETQASRDVIKKAHNIVKEVKEETKYFIKPEIEENKQQIYEKLEIGDYVRLNKSATEGKIIDLNEEKNKATILSGNIKLQVSLSELIKSKENKKSDSEKEYSSYRMPEVNYRLDIRGEKPENAEFEIIKFLDDAYQSGMERVEILHGKGTGALKKTVWDILKHYEKVKNYYFAPIEFGGEGITIVEFI